MSRDGGEVAPRRAVETVLAVDDDQHLLAALARTGDDVAVVTATSAAAALTAAATHKPQLALVDVRLGGDSGLDLVRDLKAHHPDMMVIVCSAYMSVVIALSAVRAGADDVVAKPVTVRDAIRRMAGDAPPPDLDDTPTLARVEYEHIMRVLEDCDGNVSEAARRLGIYRSTLRRRLRRQAPE